MCGGKRRGRDQKSTGDAVIKGGWMSCDEAIWLHVRGEGTNNAKRALLFLLVTMNRPRFLSRSSLPRQSVTSKTQSRPRSVPTLTMSLLLAHTLARLHPPSFQVGPQRCPSPCRKSSTISLRCFHAHVPSRASTP